MKKLILSTLIITALAWNCGSQGTEISGPEKDKIVKYADPITDSILAGYNNDDYAAYSRDFDEQMKNALPEKVFRQTRELILGKVGLYKSRALSKVLLKDSYKIVIYNGEFEKESGVEIKVVLNKYGDKDLVSGLWFNSPKLRK